AFALPSVAEAASLAWLAVVVTALAFVLWYSAVQALGVERAGLFSGVLPVSALLCAAALGHSQLTPGRVAGVLAVAAGIAAGLPSCSRAARPAPARRARARRPCPYRPAAPPPRWSAPSAPACSCSCRRRPPAAPCARPASAAPTSRRCRPGRSPSR